MWASSSIRSDKLTLWFCGTVWPERPTDMAARCSLEQSWNTGKTVKNYTGSAEGVVDLTLTVPESH